eukprot:170344-Hanusia_phi.AAC.8
MKEARSRGHGQPPRSKAPERSLLFLERDALVIERIFFPHVRSAASQRIAYIGKSFLCHLQLRNGTFARRGTSHLPRHVGRARRYPPPKSLYLPTVSWHHLLLLAFSLLQFASGVLVIQLDAPQDNLQSTVSARS